MEVIPKLDITAATRYVSRSDLFLASFSATRAAEIWLARVSSLRFSTTSVLSFSSSTTKQTVSLVFFRHRKMFSCRRMEGMKREVGVKGEVGLGPRKGFRPKRGEREEVATEISTAMEMVAREWCWGEVLSLGRGDGSSTHEDHNFRFWPLPYFIYRSLECTGTAFFLKCHSFFYHFTNLPFCSLLSHFWIFWIGNYIINCNKYFYLYCFIFNIFYICIIIF